MKNFAALRLLPVLLTILICGCRKDLHYPSALQANSESNIENFLALPDTADQELHLIVNNIRSAEETTPFIKEYAEKNGYPVWDKIISSFVTQPINGFDNGIVKNNGVKSADKNKKTDSKKAFFMIPLADRVTKEITAYIACEKKNDTAYIYKTYNKKDILRTQDLNETQQKHITPLLAVFAFFERTINKKQSVSFSGTRQYHFNNVNISHANLTSLTGTKAVQNLKIKTNSLSMPCSRVLLDVLMITYSDGGYDLVYIFSDCLTLPGVTVISSGGSTSGSGSGYSYTGLIGSSPAAYPSSGPGNMGGGYTGSPTGWSSNPWNVYWSDLLSNVSNSIGYNQGLPNPYFVQLNTLVAVLGLSQAQSEWLALYYNQEQIPQILDFLEEQEYSEESILATQIAIEAGRQGFYDSWLESIINVILDNFLPPAIKPYKELYKEYVKYQMAFEKELDSNAGPFKLFFRANAKILHMGLDFAGMIPLVGEAFDIANGIWYSFQGDWSNAAWSAASAIPILGNIPATAKIVKDGRRIVMTLQHNGTWSFASNYPYLRKSLGLLVGNPLIAHHIIPLGKQTNPLVQAAANAGFDMNAAANGIALSRTVHSGSHAAYLGKVDNEMLRRYNLIGTSITPQQAKAEVDAIINQIRDWIANNPNSHIDNIVF
jgi:hypothetical protein